MFKVSKDYYEQKQTYIAVCTGRMYRRRYSYQSDYSSGDQLIEPDAYGRLCTDC